MRKIYTILCCIIFLGLSSCQWPLDDFELQYIGSWSSRKFYLEIAANGRGYLEKRGLFGFDGVEGRIKITTNRIKFRSDRRNKTFRIDASPFYDDYEGTEVMILDGDEFYKH